MSDHITPQLRDDVLERLRAVTLTRNFKKTPEEIERLILEKARGVKKTYLDLLSRVLNPTVVGAAAAGSHNASPSPVTQSIPVGAVGPHAQVTGVQMQRSGAATTQPQQPRIQHPIPGGISIAGPGIMQQSPATIPRPRMHSMVGQPNQSQPTQQHQQQAYHPPGVQPMQPTQTLSVVAPASRAVSSAPNLGAQGMSISSQGQQPLVVYQQANASGGVIGDKSVLIRPISSQTCFLILPVVVAAAVSFTDDLAGGGGTGTPGPVLIRTTSNNSLPTIVQSDESAVPSVSVANVPIAGKSVITVLPTGQAKVVRPNLQPTPQKSASTQQSKSLLPSTVASQSAPNVAALASRSHSSDRSNGQRIDGSSGRGGSATSKPAQEVHSPEVQAQIINRLTAMAARYLPAVRQGIQMASAQPETQPYVRKYIKLRDILENPEANLNVIRLAQVQPIERLLDEIERNPMHLAQQQQQHPSQQQQQQQPKHAAAVAAAASVAAAAAASTSNLQHKAAVSDSVRKSVPMQLLSRQGTLTADQGRQQQQQQQRAAPGVQPQQGSTEQPQNRFRGSPTSMSDAHLARNPSQASPNSRALFVSTSPDVGAPSTQNASSLQTASQLGTFPAEPSGTRPAPAAVIPDGQIARTGHGVGPFSSQPRTSGMGLGGFQTSLQMLATELQKIAERATQDSSYGRRVCRAINEISQETKQFRETFGLLLPQDICPQDISKSSKDEPSDKPSDTELLPVRPCSRKRERALSEVENDKKEEESDNWQCPEGSGKVTDKTNEPQGKKICLGTQASSGQCEPPAPGQLLEHQKLQTLPLWSRHFSICEEFLETRTILFMLVDIPRTFYTPAHFVSTLCFYRFFIIPAFLFTRSIIPYDPESDPLDKFSTDQIERLNPRILCEIQRIREFHIRVEANPDPPAIDDMETYATCMDAGEWNTSCHLKLTQDDENLAYLPCAPPALMVRLAPDYLKAGHLNWFYQRRSQLSTSNSCSSSPQYSPKEREHFLDLCYAELDRTVEQQLRRVTHYRLSLYLVAKSWMDCICAAMARFVKLDQNVFLAA
ncbi:hypothetical protein T265_08862 [Opisthorchis viverrini]|uniref:Uncharacterized protein n=1 Tax=Opisthorchis viverrini TaxID=6198 RepID=A0A075A720_OPIVI|nr:hypothetical protein T265_08862 [Opisthorchis viverrini]KER23214.1 hypothetical protein T265_08862 [Opisthorchis viverrini]